MSHQRAEMKSPRLETGLLHAFRDRLVVDRNVVFLCHSIMLGVVGILTSGSGFSLTG